MRPRTQTTRTNHLGYDVGASRKIPDGALARVATAECLKANKANVLTRLALMLFRFLCFGFGVVKVALKAIADWLTTRSTGSGGSPPPFQLQVKVDGATVMLDAGSAWTAADVKAALHAKTGRASRAYYLVATGGKPLDDGAATTLAALGVGPGDRLELRGRLRGGMPSQADIRAAFALYDTNGDGLLSPDELKAIMCKQVPGGTARTEAQVDALVRQFDTDGDGMLSMEELSKAWAELELGTSYWDEVGDGKPNASALKRALADTVLVDAAWLARLADAGDILPRCQDLPAGARVTLEEMEQWKDNTVGVLVISYPWWASPFHARAPCLERPARPPLPLQRCTWPTLPSARLGARTGSTPTTRTRTGCSCARSRTCSGSSTRRPRGNTAPAARWASSSTTSRCRSARGGAPRTTARPRRRPPSERR